MLLFFRRQVSFFIFWLRLITESFFDASRHDAFGVPRLLSFVAADERLERHSFLLGLAGLTGLRLQLRILGLLDLIELLCPEQIYMSVLTFCLL